MTGFGTADAAAREAAWLAAGPGLLRSSPTDTSGVYDVIQAYMPKSPGMVQAVYVLRPTVQILRQTAPLSLARYTMRLRVYWPLLDPDGVAENDQAGFDAALDLLLARIVGPQFDKSHGGQFMAVAATPVGTNTTGIGVVMDDVERAIINRKPLSCLITYTADDHEQNF